MRNPARDHRHRAVVDAGGHHAKPGGHGDARHGFGFGIGGNINIADRHAQQRIAHAAAHEQRPRPRSFQRGADGLRRFGGDPIARNPHSRSASPRNMRAVAPQM